MAGGGGGGATPPPDTGGGAGGGVGGGDGVLFDMVLATRSGEEVDRAKWSWVVGWAGAECVCVCVCVWSRTWVRYGDCGR